MSRTPFTETEILLAIMDDDSDHARELAADLLPGERDSLLAALRTMAIIVRGHDGYRRE